MEEDDEDEKRRIPWAKPRQRAVAALSIGWRGVAGVCGALLVVEEECRYVTRIPTRFAPEESSCRGFGCVYIQDVWSVWSFL